MTIFLELVVKPPEEEDRVCRLMVVGTRVSEVVTMGMVVATPLMVVTMSVVKVLMEGEYEVERLCCCCWESSVLTAPVVSDPLDEEEVGVPDADWEDVSGADEEVGELEFVVNGTDDDVTTTLPEDEEVTTPPPPVVGETLTVLELSAASCRRSTSLRACSSMGSARAVTRNIVESITAKTKTAIEITVRIVDCRPSSPQGLKSRSRGRCCRRLKRAS